ncbi:WXG100 family type VII secretion target [Paenibacillus sp. KQZ6P-2]|uniref:WXG100 family type VII secretion target n=1 Tax=Paenibacillus mangrovi TaxID=2931978 RepID=A0A9X2B1S3_9BACL|nr:WXG100 family type VII secretion target [Paenibacillus mangrovi]MCJ8011819.1 WXG100 family type VII secretion target [Paenibacillus mangrovi]
MPTPAELRNKATAVNTASGNIRREANAYRNQMNGTADWWQGDAGNAIRQSYSAIHADVDRLLSKLDTLKSRLNGLVGEVQRADDERRRKAEEARRLAEEKRRREAAARK